VLKRASRHPPILRIAAKNWLAGLPDFSRAGRSRLVTRTCAKSGHHAIPRHETLPRACLLIYPKTGKLILIPRKIGRSVQVGRRRYASTAMVAALQTKAYSPGGSGALGSDLTTKPAYREKFRGIPSAGAPLVVIYPLAAVNTFALVSSRTSSRFSDFTTASPWSTA